MNLLMFGRLFLMLRVVRYHSPLLSSNGRFIGCVRVRRVAHMIRVVRYCVLC